MVRVCKYRSQNTKDKYSRNLVLKKEVPSHTIRAFDVGHSIDHNLTQLRRNIE